MLGSGTSPVQPVVEQQRALELFCAGGNLRVDAYAGTGKTTTLRLLAGSKPGRALYLAFNRSIAAEAQQRFPAHVKCATTHSVAFRGVRRSLGYPEWKLTEPLTPNLILEAFCLPATITFHSGVVLEQRSYAILARSNAGVMTNVLRCLAQSLRCAVVGGTKELQRVLADVQRVKQGQPAQSPELVGFQSWKDVMSFSNQAEGEGLRALVNLV